MTDDQRMDDAPAKAGGEAPRTWLGRHGGQLFLIGFALYLVLLTIGVVAEVFDIEPILDWWIWRPPGKPPGNY